MMKIKFSLICLLFLFFATNIFAKEKNIILFFENIESVPNSILNKINASDKLCISATINNPKNVSQTVRNLIFTNKIEPTLSIDEPYFTFISSEVFLTNDISFNRSKDLDLLISNYKSSLKTNFERRKYGMYLKNGIVDDDSLKIFYKKNIYWITTKLQNNLNNKAFIKDNVVVFVPFTDLPQESKNIESWLLNKNGNIIPIFINKNKLGNEKFMLQLLNIIEKNKNYDVLLPVNASYYIAKNTKEQDNLKFESINNIPTEILWKIAKASEEYDKQIEKDNNNQITDLLYGELTNMYSCDIINGILANNKSSKQLFDISYENVFKLCGDEVPNMDKLIKKNLKEINNKNANEYKFEKNGSKYIINNDQIIKSFSIYKDSQFIIFNLDYDTNDVDNINIYIDMNNMSYAGNQKLLKNMGFFVPENCWEYVIEIDNKNFTIYRFIVDKINKVFGAETASQKTIKIPLTIFRGNPYNWHYQVVAVKNNKVVDFLETTQTQKEKVFNETPLLLKMINIK